MKNTNSSINKWLLWTPRIICIAFAAFISIFAADSFSENGIGRILLALFMHLLTTTIPVVIVLILSWKWEWVGGVIYNLLGILYVFTFGIKHPNAIPTIAGPLFLVGILFLIVWFKKRANNKELTVA